MLSPFEFLQVTMDRFQFSVCESSASEKANLKANLKA
jgi:hypothetical protein